MQAKKYVSGLVLIFLLSYILLYLTYYLVNPEQSFEKSVTEKKFFYTKEYSRKQFEMLKEGNYTLVFGTSQIHRISSEMMGSDLLNFHNLYGEPGDVINFLQQLSPQQIDHIDKIIYCIDLEATPGRPEGALIAYQKQPFPSLALTRNQLSRTVEDLTKNLNAPSITGYLNRDGSITNLRAEASTHITPYPYPIAYRYDQKLIDGILEVNRLAAQYDKEILFITPVTNDVYLKQIDFYHLTPFYSALLEGGITKLKLFYYIPGMSDLRDNKGRYIAFMDEKHLNSHYVKKWLKGYILKDTVYDITDRASLNAYIEQIEAYRKTLNSHVLPSV